MSNIYTYNEMNFKNSTEINVTQLRKIINKIITLSIIVYSADKNNKFIVKISFDNKLTTEQLIDLDKIVSDYVFSKIDIESVSASHQVIVSNDPLNKGDYKSITEAFNAGESSVFVRNGVYIETSDIIIPNGGRLTGELPGRTCVYFKGPYCVKIDGSKGISEKNGTVSILNNSTSLKGTGTTFTNLVHGNFILLGTNYYKILSIESDTQITLDKIYKGVDIVDKFYIAQAMYTGCVVSDLTIKSPLGQGLYVRGLRHGGMKSIALNDCKPCFTIVDSSDISLFQVICCFSTGIGFCIKNSWSISLHTVSVFNSSSHGFKFDGVNIICESCSTENNSGDGIYIDGSCSDFLFDNSTCKNNNGNGIVALNTTDSTNISNCDISNNGIDGINMLNSKNNIVSTSFICNNKGNGIVTGLYNNINCNNINGNKGDGIIGYDNCIVNANMITNNTGNGINITGNKLDLTSNHVINSGINGILTTSTKNRISNNTITGSSLTGILLDESCTSSILSGNIIDTSGNNGLVVSTGAINNIVTSNNLENNTGTNFINNGTGTIDSINIM
jgi:hypothetical protein